MVHDRMRLIGQAPFPKVFDPGIRLSRDKESRPKNHPLKGD
jgi:hypothetical protein